MSSPESATHAPLGAREGGVRARDVASPASGAGVAPILAVPVAVGLHVAVVQVVDLLALVPHHQCGARISCLCLAHGLIPSGGETHLHPLHEAEGEGLASAGSGDTLLVAPGPAVDEVLA